MSPVQIAAVIYRTEPCARSFREDLEAHLLHGIVYSTATAFAMARYVSADWSGEDVVNPWCNGGNRDHLDTLHVYLAAGDLSEMLAVTHLQVKNISFERSNRLRIYDYLTFKKRCKTISMDRI